MNGDDIKYHNDTLPRWPRSMPLWQRVLCLFGYHKWETRQTAKGHRYGNGTLHDDAPMKLRDQCGRCSTLR
jgi:hypothetical protein